MKFPKVFVVISNFPDNAISLLRERCEVEVYSGLKKTISRKNLLEKIKGVHGVLCTISQKIDAEFLDAAGPQLRVIATTSVGFDHIDLTECRRRNVAVGHTPEVLTEAVAEFTVMLLLAATRNMMSAIKHVKAGTSPIGWNPTWMLGYGLAGSTVGLVGLGRIGVATLQKLKAFNVARFFYCGSTPKSYAPALGAEYVSFHDLLRKSDFVIALCPAHDSSIKMFNTQAFATMKPTACFINTGRGSLVDQEALYEALTKGVIRSAGLDVTTPEPLPPDHPLLHLDNCVITPHHGAREARTIDAMTELSVRNIVAGLEGKPLPAQVV